MRGKAYEAGWDGTNRRRLEEEVLRSRSEPGVLAYREGTAVGWCRVGPRESFARLEASRVLARPDEAEVWSVVCFYVDPVARRAGVSAALLEGAVAHAAARGASLLEAYPVQPGHPTIDAYTGYAQTLRAAGFEPVAPGGRRTIVRRRVA